MKWFTLKILSLNSEKYLLTFQLDALVVFKPSKDACTASEVKGWRESILSSNLAIQQPVFYTFILSVPSLSQCSFNQVSSLESVWSLQCRFRAMHIALNRESLICSVAMQLRSRHFEWFLYLMHCWILHKAGVSLVNCRCSLLQIHGCPPNPRQWAHRNRVKRTSMM